MVVVLFYIAITSPALTGDGKVFREKGEGSVNQIQQQGPHTF